MKLLKKHNGQIETKFLWLIVFILGISKSTITNKEGNKKQGEVYTLHFTPFFSWSFHWRTKQKEDIKKAAKKILKG